MKIRFILPILLFITLVSFFLNFNLVYSKWSSPGVYFSATPDPLYLNWSNTYRANLTLTANSSYSIDITLEMLNSTGFSANYTQPYGGSDLSVCQPIPALIQNLSTYSTVAGPLNGGGGNNQANVSLSGNHPECRPGRYNISLVIRNYTNSTENLNVPIYLDIPISSTNNPSGGITTNLLTTGIGSFGGTLPVNATTYHSYYFNTSEITNATGITVNLTGWSSSQDVDLFLFDDSGNLKEKSINKNTSESLSYSYLPLTSAFWEIRVYGNSTSTIPYTGYIIFTGLNVSNSTKHQISSIDFGEMNASTTSIMNLTLTNVANFTLTKVLESKELYRVQRFTGSGTRNFTFLVPGSSVATKVKVVLNWTGGGNYSFNLYNSNETLLVSSANKYVYANKTNSMQEEYNETTDMVDVNFWKVEIKNNTNASFIDTYTITTFVYVNASNWLASNFTSSGITFNSSGQGNYSHDIQINRTVPNSTMDGVYEGSLRYRDNRGGEIKIPIKITVNTSMLIVTNDYANPIPFSVLNSGTFRNDENYGSNLTRSFNFKLNNNGSYDVVVALTNSSNIFTCTSSSCSGYTASLGYSLPSNTISKNSYQTLTANIIFNSSIPTGTYEGWIFVNATSDILSSSSHPYQNFNLTLKLNLTNKLYMNVSENIAASGGNIVQNIGNGENVTVKFNVYYINKTTEITELNTSNFTRVWLQEKNVSGTTGRIPSSGSLSIFNGTNPIYVTKYSINASVPANQPGGQYEVHVMAAYNRSDSKSFEIEGINSSTLIINNTGFYMNSSSSSLSVTNGSSTTFRIYVYNFGPLSGNTNVYFDKGSCPVTVSTACEVASGSCSASGANASFSSFPAYVYGNTYNATWTITGAGSGSCTATIYGTSKWFNNISLSVTVNPSTTSTTASSGQQTTSNATTTTTTRSNATTTTTTTTTTPPPQLPVNVTVTIQLTTPDSPAVFNISKPEILKIHQVILAVKKNVSNVVITVKEASHPTGAPNVTDPETGIIFKYLDITATNITANDIANVTIKFQIEQSLINSTKADVGTIILYRHFNNTWIKLPTKKISETKDLVNFESFSPGLSIFVIAGQRAKGFPFWMVYLVAGVAAISFLIYLFWPVKTEKERPPVELRVPKVKEEDVFTKLKEKWEKVSKRKK